MKQKQNYPFRLGTTSYIVPADIIPNVLYLSDKVDDIELVLFESDEFSNLPAERDIDSLAAIAAENGLTYSVHLPLDVYFGHEDAAVRKRSVEKCLRVIDLTNRLNPSAYVMHFEAGPAADINGFSADRKLRLADDLRDALYSLLQRSPAEAERFCVETLNYPFELVYPVIEETGLSVTLDIGHLEFYGFPVADYLERFLPMTGVLHMHGVTDGRDHNSLHYMRKDVLRQVLDALDRDARQRVLTLEVFSEDDLRNSIAALDHAYGTNNAAGA